MRLARELTGQVVPGDRSRVQPRSLDRDPRHGSDRGDGGRRHSRGARGCLRRRLNRAPTSCSWCMCRSSARGRWPGTTGAEYMSPPQEREQALQLVELVLGQAGRGERRARALLAPAGRRRPAQRHAAARRLARPPTRGAPVPGSAPAVRTPRKGGAHWQQPPNARRAPFSSAAGGRAACWPG